MSRLRFGNEPSPSLHKQNCDILRCQECRLGRADTTGFDPANYYSNKDFSGGHTDGYADYLGTEPVLRREFGREVDFIRKSCPRPRCQVLPSAGLRLLPKSYGFGARLDSMVQSPRRSKRACVSRLSPAVSPSLSASGCTARPSADGALWSGALEPALDPDAPQRPKALVKPLEAAIRAPVHPRWLRWKAIVQPERPFPAATLFQPLPDPPTTVANAEWLGLVLRG